MEGRTVRPLSQGATGVHTRAPTPMGALAAADSRKRPTGYPLVADPAPQPTLRTRPLTSRVILHRSRTPRQPFLATLPSSTLTPAAFCFLSHLLFRSRLRNRSYVPYANGIGHAYRSFADIGNSKFGTTGRQGQNFCKRLHCNELTEFRPSLSMEMSSALI